MNDANMRYGKIMRKLSECQLTLIIELILPTYFIFYLFLQTFVMHFRDNIKSKNFSDYFQ